ncbi:alpha/beta-hydrolase [Penicillium sp. IBT 35674x]|nr:alpha/beta-hydrolase [Penicillium sp. IBT 35674x]
MFDAREQWYQAPSHLPSKTLDDAKVLCVDYRPATVAHFPCSTTNAFTAYYHLVEDLNIDPSRIVLSGDSAGVHVAIGMLQHFADTRTSLTPCAALL